MFSFINSQYVNFPRVMKMFVSIVIAVLLYSYTNAAFLSEGDSCPVTPTQTAGKCVNINKCDYARQLLQKQQKPSLCGFKRNTPIVCCPQQGPKSGGVSQKMCSSYQSKSRRIILGEEAVSREFPHMAAIGYGDDLASVQWLCGGSLITHYFVLSAAHCGSSIQLGAAKYVRLGDLDLKNATEDADPVDFAVAQIFVHPQYKSSSHYHDIALFRLSERVRFGPYTIPACLQTDPSLPVKTVQAIGWGKLDFFGDSSSHLMKVSLNIVSYKTCTRKYEKSRKLKDGILDQYHICAGNSAGGDTCPGDSGGPLHYRKEETGKLKPHFVVVGVTSFGKGCGGENSVAVYTRVSSYVEWIENIVWPETD